MATANLAPGFGSSRACSQITIALHGQTLDSVGWSTVAGGPCGGDLQLALGGTAQFDPVRNVVRIPVILENRSSSALGSPARIYGWEDSLVVLSPPGLAHNKHTATYLAFVNEDSTIGAGADRLAGAAVWKLDSLLAATDSEQTLAPGGTSAVKWIEVLVKQGVHEFALSIEAEANAVAGPAGIVVIVRDGGVGGTAWSDTTGNVGDRLSYGFVPMPGYTNVQVRVDGQAASDSGDVVVDAAGHAITATADRIITIPSRAIGLYTAAEAVLTAADVPAAYQAYLDSIYEYQGRSTDAGLAEQDVRAVEDSAFNFLTHEAALRRVDAALAGYSFRFGPDSLGDPGGAPIVNPGDTGVVIVDRVAGGESPRHSLAQAPGDTIEPTVYLYVNGIWTGALRTYGTYQILDSLVAAVPGLGSKKITTRFFYNRTWVDQVPTPLQRRVDCTAAFNDAHVDGGLGANSLASYIATCTQDTTVRRATDEDLLESLSQVIDIVFFNASVPKVDAVRLANDIQRYRKLGRHVIVVPHSQGNLMAVQAIEWLSQHGGYGGLNDPACLGVVSLASPVAASRFGVPEHQHAAVAVDGDLVADLGGTAVPPRISTVLSRAVAASAAELAKTRPITAQLYRTLAGVSTLHSVDSSYFRYEAADAVKRGLVQVYGACTVHDLEPIQPATIVQRGSRFNVNFNFFNSYGDLLRRPDTVLTRTIADSTIVGPDGTGVFRALTNGTTSITAIYGGHSATTVVHVVDPIPPAIAGQWSGTWASETNPAAFGTMQVTVSGNVFAMSATVTWTDQAGQVWHAFSTSYPTNIINDDPNLSSTARFWASYKKPTEPNGFDFFRFFILSNPRGSNQATGSASDGSGLDTWQISLTRVVNP